MTKTTRTTKWPSTPVRPSVPAPPGVHAARLLRAVTNVVVSQAGAGGGHTGGFARRTPGRSGEELTVLVEALERVKADPNPLRERAELLIEIRGAEEPGLVLLREHLLEGARREVDVLHVEKGPVPLVEVPHVHRARHEGVGELAESFAIVGPLPQVIGKPLAKPLLTPGLIFKISRF